jgi:DNA-binding transcriptional regulator YhcF (GntR family)
MDSAPRLRIDPASTVPVVRQITDSLRVLFVEGRLAAGTALPSVRRVAMELGVHFNTVAEAYRILAAEGWLEVKQGRGAVLVARTAPALASEAWREDFRSRLRALLAQMRAQGVPAARLAAELRGVAKEVTRT